MSFLRLSIIGNIGGDAVVRDVAENRKVISFNVAHTESYRDRNGIQNEKTTWVRCSYFREADKIGVAQYLLRGSQVYVEGQPSVSTYVNKEGQTVATLDMRVDNLRLLGSKPAGGGSPQTTYQPSNQTTNATPTYNPPAQRPAQVTEPSFNDAPEEDDLPF